MCYKIEILQQVIDHTYTGDVDEVMSHINTCSICRDAFEKLKNQEMLVENALKAGIVIPTRSPIHSINNTNKGRNFKMNKLARRWTAAAAVVAIGTGLLFVDPVIAKAQDLLKIFRMNEMTTVSISESDIREIDEVFRKGNGSKEIENFVKIDVSSQGKEINIAGLESGNEIKEKMPSAKVIKVKDDFKYGYASIYPKQDITLKLDVNKANAFLNYLGEDTKIPQALNNKPFTIHSEDVINYSIEKKSANKDEIRKYINVTQMKVPSIEMQSDIDEKELIKLLFSMDFLPNNLKKQFMSIDHITSTIPIPYNSDTQIKEEITIRGKKAIVVKEKDSEYDYLNLFFKEGDKLYSISSNCNIDEILPFIEEMK
ncbi:hypothetical protein IZY60_04300 [Lutibacter sp. B2]|nr:hypothetical protein [Lutibacter sp. B2]